MILACQNIAKSFASADVLRDITFHIEEHEKAALIGRNAEITRFKGLGEISPKEFRQFIDENIRLEQVTIDQTKGINEMLRFYMGDNTPERWEFIQNNLV